MRNCLWISTFWICLFSVPRLASAAKSVTFYFDPADFYSFLDLGPGGTDQWSYEGDMFKLYEVWHEEDPTRTTLRSWQAADRTSLEAWKASLSAGEGIGFFNVSLSESAGAAAWGQTIPTALSIESVIAPAGWSTAVEGNQAGWSADSLANMILPESTPGPFGFIISMGDSFVTGTDYTIWFGGYNWTGFSPAVTFNANWGGDPNEYASLEGNPGSGFETTLRLTALGEDDPTADFDADGNVDGADFLVWQIGFGTTSGAGLADGDADGDGDVDGDDLSVWAQQSGTASSPVAVGGAVVPEPAAWASILVILASLAAIRRF